MVENKIEQSLVVPKKANIFIKFFKWIASLVNRKDEELEELVEENKPNIIIPEAVQIPGQVMAQKANLEEGSLEYLYCLSDKELDRLDKFYDDKIEDSKKELLRLNEILHAYKEELKKYQT